VKQWELYKVEGDPSELLYSLPAKISTLFILPQTHPWRDHPNVPRLSPEPWPRERCGRFARTPTIRASRFGHPEGALYFRRCDSRVLSRIILVVSGLLHYERDIQNTIPGAWRTPCPSVQPRCLDRTTAASGARWRRVASKLGWRRALADSKWLSHSEIANLLKPGEFELIRLDHRSHARYTSHREWLCRYDTSARFRSSGKLLTEG